MENIFEKASRCKLRFDINGQVSTEQLWNVTQATLAEYEQHLQELVESYGKSTRRTKKIRTGQQELNELRLAIVTHVLDTLEKESEESANRVAAKEYNQKILALIQAKRQDELAGKSVEELEAMLK